MRSLLITAAAALTLAGCGGADLGTESTGTGITTTGTGTPTGMGTGTTTTTYEMGNGSGSGFQSGMIGISSANVAAGGTTSLTITVVDQSGVLYTAAPVIVSYSSTCISNGEAVIAPSGTSTAGTTADTVTSSTGTIDATYTAKGCSGPDVITATAAVGSVTLTATGTVSVAAATIGSIQFESATPSSIGLKGTGLNETSTVIFKVVDSSGGGQPGVTVSFSLNTTAGGLSLSPSSATSAADGTVQTVVSSGTEHTAVRVTAAIASPALSTQSSNLTVSTGLPASGAFSIAVGAPSYATSGPACPNVEAYTFQLFTVPVTVQLADRYNNPAPDGTSVAFTSDGGHVAPSCTTPLNTPGDGECQVNWTSANPVPTTADNPAPYRNGRVQILATAIGEESFTDVNQTGYYVVGDPFSNLGEPYLDTNESGAYVVGDYFDNYFDGSAYEGPSGKFIGITCTGSSCSTSTLAIGVEHLLIMSTSNASIGGGPNGTFSYSGTYNPSTGAASGPVTFIFSVQDLNGNPMAAGTTVTAVASVGTLTGSGTSFTIGCDSGGGPSGSPSLVASPLSVTWTPPTSPGSGNILISVTSPGTKSVTTLSIPVSGG